jgi:D-alanyl-D-alanine carboxypeptidase
MNAKARELGLQQTSYTDPSGLLSDNVSSAFDMARLIAVASSDERVASIHANAVLHGVDEPPRESTSTARISWW